MSRPTLLLLGLGVTLSLCACALDTSALGPDAGRVPMTADTGAQGVAGPGDDETGAAGAAGDGGGTDDVTTDAAPPQEMDVVSAVGCADGTREGFLSVNSYPGIAACAGAWTEPGLLTPSSRDPLCDRQAGNSGAITNGGGCSAADLCATGWHVCESFAEVSLHAKDCDDAVNPANGSPIFFATRQPASASACNDTGTSNIIGCGNIGFSATESCAPLNVGLGSTFCGRYPPWQCGDEDDVVSTELLLVTKPASARGGLLCCLP